MQGAPQALNFAYLFKDSATSQQQAARDIFFGALFLVFSGIYADLWPASYRNAPTANGLVISANVFGNVQAITEIIQIDDVENMPEEAVIKMVLYTVGNILSLTGNMLNATHPAPPSAPTPPPPLDRDTDKRELPAGRINSYLVLADALLPPRPSVLVARHGSYTISLR